MKLLLVGDVHAQLGSLPECGQLIDFIAQRAEELKPNYIVFLGDQYDGHSLVRVEVMDFWRKAFDRLSAYQVIALVGNHDRSGSGDSHAMVAHAEQVTVVNEPLVLGTVLCLPYYSDAEEFVKAAKLHSAYTETVICHQTFQGANYDNGFYARDGIDLGTIPQLSVISGHIHTEQRIGKCWYPGSPRWLTLSDARHNLNKAIWEVNITDDGAATHKKLETHEVCSPMRALSETPESTFSGELEKNARYIVDLSGPLGWIEERLDFWKDKARVRTFPESAPSASVKESDGVCVAFDRYLKSFCPKFGTSIVELEKMSKDRGIFAI